MSGEAARVLRPGGRLALFWNSPEPAPAMAEAFAEVHRRVVPGSLAARAFARPAMDAYSALYAKAVDGMRQAGGFGVPEQWRFDWERAYTRDEWLDVLPTQGGHAQSAPGESDEILAGIGAAVDAAGGSFTMRYTTVVATATRSGGA